MQLLIGFCWLAPVAASSQVVDEGFPGVSAGVTSFTRFGATLYVVGGFTSAGTNSGGGVPVDLSSGAMLEPFARVAGTVYACVPDGRGGWFIGGDFGGVGGLPRANLAHISGCGAVTDWSADTDGRVNALALAGNVLYVGGEFEHVADEQHAYLAAIRAADGRPLPWNPRIAGVGKDYTCVLALAILGNRLYVGGDFADVGGISRRNLACVELTTARPTSLALDPDDRVRALAVSDTALYIGGAFHAIGGVRRYCLAAAHAVTGALLAIDPHFDAAYYSYDLAPFVNSIAIEDTLLYVAGHFTRVGSDVRGGVAAVGRSSGRATEWNPHPIDENQLSWAPFISQIRLGKDLAYIAGAFDSMGGAPRHGAAAVSKRTGTATSWTPRPCSSVLTIAVSGSSAYLGGSFALFGDWVARNGLAAVDLTTDSLLAWQPTCDGGIGAIVADSSAVYIGGSFTSVNGVPRSGLAALDPGTGETLPWNPGTNGVVTALALTGGRVLVGGEFTQLAGVPRWCLGSVDKTTGAADSWVVDADAGPTQIVPDGDLVYVSGLFQTISSQPRRFCAAIDLQSGTPTSWNPDPDVFVESMAVGPNAVYLGGPFGRVGSAFRNALAAVDKVTGVALDWNPGAERWPGFGGARIYGLLLRDSSVYVAGAFVLIGGARRNLVAALSPTTGLVRPWNLDLVGDAATSLVSWQDKLYVGGVFSRLGVLPVSGIGASSPWVLPRPPPGALALAPCVPNPASSAAALSFALPVATTVRLDAFDVLGRHVAAVLRGEERPAGRNEISVDVHDWRPGFYLYRLEAGGRTAVGKFLVVH